MDLNAVQKRVMANKVKKGFNTTDLHHEFCYLYGEVAEAFEAYSRKKPDLGSELADVALFLLGIAEMLGISLEDEIERKLVINEAREYQMVDGVFVKKENLEGK